MDGLLLLRFGRTLLIASVILVGLSLPTRGSSIPTYSTELETALRTAVYTGYEVLQRPSQTVNISIGYNLLTINGLDIKEQLLSTSGYFSMSWSDSRLEWRSVSNYTNVRFLFSSQTYTWRPAIVVENSVKDISVISDVNTLMRVNADGDISWSPGGIYETSCDVDPTYYPLDTQTCSLKLSTWAYTSNELNLLIADPAIDMTHFSENGEWEVLSTSSSLETASRESQSFARVAFTLTLRRRPLFHILNTIFPVILMASLTVFVFQLPPESGERVGLCLTVLLAYAVYLTLISDNIPQTSLSASLLSTYLAIILLLSALSVILTIFVLGVYFKPEEEPIPDWLQTFTRKFLIHVTCWRKTTCCWKKDKITPSDEKADKEEFHVSKVSLDEKHNNNSPSTPPKTCFGNVGILERGKTKNYEKEKSIIIVTSNETDLKSYTWKEIALMLDKMFFYLFVFLVFTATLTSISILIAQF